MDSWYRPLLKKNGEVHICHMDWSDYDDECNGLFLTEEKFPTEVEAIGWVLYERTKWGMITSIDSSTGVMNL